MNPITDLSTILENLLMAEEAAAGDPVALAECEAHYQELIRIAPHHPEGFRYYNRFRLRNLDRLPVRPHVLVGTMGEREFPNLHTYELIRIADVVALTVDPGQAAIDTVHFNPYADSMAEILPRMPVGFKPIMFWDNQIEGRHILPSGLEEAPFTTIAAVEQTWRRDAVRRLTTLFDVIVAMSPTAAAHLREVTDRPVIEVPFGLNWGAMSSLIEPAHQKGIDLAVVVDEYASGGRNERLLARLRRFAALHGDRYEIRFSDGQSDADRLDLLAHSRIVINMIDPDAAYNRLTCETMAAGAMLMQPVSDRPEIEYDLKRLFTPGHHLVQFNSENLEESLLNYLEDPQSASIIADRARGYCAREFSYERLYIQLFDQLADIEIDTSKRPGFVDALFNQGVGYWYSDNVELSKVGALLAIQTLTYREESERYNNLLVLLPQLTRWFSLDVVAQLLHGDELVAATLKRDLGETVELLSRRLTDSPLMRWNRLAARIELGLAEQAEVEGILHELESITAGIIEEPRLLFNSRLQPDYLEPAETSYARREVLYRGIERNGEDAMSIAACYREFIRWHCQRWLIASQGARSEAPHIDKRHHRAHLSVVRGERESAVY